MTRVAFALAASLIAFARPPAPAIAQAVDDGLPSKQQGMGFIKDPSGALVTRVVKESAAERAGVTEGMVITHIDGLPLRDLSTLQIARLFAGSGDKVEIKIRGAGTITVGGSAGSASSSAFRVGGDTGYPGY
jgi:S1-C subfamily serine protease